MNVPEISERLWESDKYLLIEIPILPRGVTVGQSSTLGA
jgi:hypothetical protein